jgi:hypothetical protein
MPARGWGREGLCMSEEQLRKMYDAIGTVSVEDIFDLIRKSLPERSYDEVVEIGHMAADLTEDIINIMVKKQMEGK